jgi:uncharacterized small protein (DUF1192 family)
MDAVVSMKPHSKVERLADVELRISNLRSKVSRMRAERDARPDSDWKTNARWRGIRKNP